MCCTLLEQWFAQVLPCGLWGSELASRLGLLGNKAGGEQGRKKGSAITGPSPRAGSIQFHKQMYSCDLSLCPFYSACYSLRPGRGPQAPLQWHHSLLYICFCVFTALLALQLLPSILFLSTFLSHSPGFHTLCILLSNLPNVQCLICLTSYHQYAVPEL